MQEQNIQEQKQNKLQTMNKKYQLLKKIWFVLFNMAYIIAYSVFTGLSLVNKNQQVPWLPYVLGAFILMFLVLFIVTVVQGSKDQVKSIKKDYKSSFKIIKKLLKLINLAMTITIVAGVAITSAKNMFELVLMCISIIYVVFQILMEVIKFFKRKKKEKKKAEKQALKAEKKKQKAEKRKQVKEKLLGNSANKDEKNN